MGRTDSDINDFILELNKDIARVVDNKVAEEVKEVYKEEVEYMYTEYEPVQYIRRYEEGGFLDERNWDMNIDFGKNNIELELFNETEPYNYSNYRLDELIEDGLGYLPFPRPISKRAEQRVSDEQVVENSLESELRKIGYKFE